MPLVFRIDFETTSWVDAFVSTLSITIVSSLEEEKLSFGFL
jgi:hypothetical protein